MLLKRVIQQPRRRNVRFLKVEAKPELLKIRTIALLNVFARV